MVSQTNNCFFCNWPLTLGSSRWFTHFIVKVEKLSLVTLYCIIFHSPTLPEQLKVPSFGAHSLSTHTALPTLAFLLTTASCRQPPLLPFSCDLPARVLTPRFPSLCTIWVSLHASPKSAPQSPGPRSFLHLLQSYRTWSLRLFTCPLIPVCLSC